MSASPSSSSSVSIMSAASAESSRDESAMNEEELQRALSVLAGSDAENCSYPQGYIKRQAVFACNTCTPSTAAEPAGICLACANKCHDGHDIFELYTKRNFCCDCGNEKFAGFQCQLNPVKDKRNIKNHYNHNFKGHYCTCDRPYPDTEDQDDDEMIQCVVCEDWFHSRHLGCSVEEPQELQEMVCEACMNKAPFLWTYAAHFAVPHVVNISCPKEAEKQEVGVVVEEDGIEKEESNKDTNEGPSAREEHGTHQEVVRRSSPCKRTREEMNGSPTKASGKAACCRLKELEKRGPQRSRQGAVFWPYSWRSELCTCISCKKAYVAADVPFLMDQSDTVLAYEKRGLDEPFGQHPLMALMGSMNHVQQLEVIYGFNELTTSMTAFFEKCVSERKTVTEEAVYQFFEELQAKKRRRINTGYQ